MHGLRYRTSAALATLLLLATPGCAPAGTTGDGAAPATSQRAADVSDETLALAGTYRATFTEADMEGAPPRLTTPESLATLPWVQTLTLEPDGSVTAHSRWEGGEEIDDTGTYSVDGDELTIAWSGAGNTSVYEFTAADDSLTLRGDTDTMPADELFAFTTLTSERID